MFFPDRTSNYDKRPVKQLEGTQGCLWSGYEAIAAEISRRIAGKSDAVVVIDLYHGTRHDEIVHGLVEALNPDATFFCEECKLSEEQLWPLIEREVTDDRVFGRLSTRVMSDFYDMDAIAQTRDRVEAARGIRVVYGVGTGIVTRGDVLVYCDLNRWEIQLRYRSGELDNWGVGNFDEDILRKYKRGYFLEWRVMDRHKLALFDDVDLWVETNVADKPNAVDAAAMSLALSQFAAEPFRLVPYFDAGIWGGHWMEEVCDLPAADNKYAWCFDGVPEENSIAFCRDGITYEMPAMNLVKRCPRALLGEKVFSRFGAEFPIRFDFLDTMGGGNLSLQVHPNTEFIQQNFAMPYTQDESYYILDADENAHVYLGVKDGTKPEELISALERANAGDEQFDDAKFVNCFPVKKHDHVLIPAGTVHCSGSGTMVLEISATPYIFTLKLWDWGRVGLDGKPRPVNVERGAKNIRYDRTTDWCARNLIHRTELLEEGAHARVERTGLHNLEFIETRRHWFSEPHVMDCNGSVNVLNLIEGEAATVSSPTGAFTPVTIHYAETFIVPESVGSYVISPSGASEGSEIAVIQAYVRS